MDQNPGVFKRIKTLIANLKPFLFRNTTDEQTVAKNTVWLSISNFGGRMLKAVVIIYAARVLDPVRWGVVSYAITLAGFFTLFVDPGINVLLMREGAKAEEKHQLNLLSTTFYMKVVLIVLVVLFVLFVGPTFTLLPGAQFLLPVTALIIIGDTLREFFSSFIRAKEKMEWEARIFLLTNFFIVILGFAALILFHTERARAFGWAYAAGTTIGALIALWVLRPYLRKLFSNFSSKLVLPIIRSAWPFAITGALGALLTNADILIISWMRTAAEVGIYSAAVRIVQVLYLFPVVIQYSTLPLFSRLAKNNNQRFREVFEQAIIIIFAVSIPIAFCGIFLGGAIMKFVFGAAYAAGGPSLAILLLTMIVDYPGGVISVAIFAYDHQKALINASIIGGVSNVLFDLILIPRYGITGSAVATLIAQTLNNAYLWYVMKKINHFEVLPRLKKITFASAVIAATSALLLLAHAPLIVIVILVVVLYGLLLVTLREPIISALAKMTRQQNISAGTGTAEEKIAPEATVPAAAESTAATVRIGKKMIMAEVVRDTDSIRRGLSGRDFLDPEKAMLFVFPEPRRYRFWMRGMRFPIDIIWICDDTIVGITRRIAPKPDAPRPRFYYAPRKANYVLEVNAGYAEQNGIAVGDKITLENARRKLTIASASDEKRHAWNKFVAENHPSVGAFLESWEWGIFQKRLGWRTEHYIISENDRMVAVFAITQYNVLFGFSQGYSPRGPVIAKEYVDEEMAHLEILQAIKKWAHEYPSPMIFLRLEPSIGTLSSDVEFYGFRTPSYYVQPRHNTAVPLAPPEQEILARFHPSTRSNINRAVRRGVTVQMKRKMTDADCDEFFSMIKSTVARNGGKNVYPDEQYLRTFLKTMPIVGEGEPSEPATFSLGIFWGLQNGEPAAAHIVVFFGGTATYLFGASHADKLNSKIETFLHWTAMQEAKKRGMRYYDLGGIDERIWPSLTAFKRQFGGEEFHYVGSVDIPLRPLWYRFYNFSKKTLKKLRHQG